MAVNLSPLFNGIQIFAQGTNTPLSGGLINTYVAGSSTPLATYTDNTGGTPCANPIQLGTDGRLPTELWLTAGSSYKFVLTDSLGLNAVTFDNITAAAQSSDVTTFAANLANVASAALGPALVGYNKSLAYPIGTVGGKLIQYQSVFDYMTAAQIADVQAGTHLLNIDVAFQAAVTAVCGASKTLLIPAGVYVLGTPITFPNKSWQVVGEGPTDTAISSSSSSTSQRLFDLTGCNGPEHVIQNLSFNGKIGSGTTTSIGVYVDTANGIVIRGCWFRGLSTGCQKTNNASYVDLLDCAYEFCSTGINWSDAIQCSVQNSVFYWNLTDAFFTGNLDHMTWANSRHANTNTYGIRFSGASNGKFYGITAYQNGAAFTPDILRFEGASLNNFIDGASTIGFGRVLVSMASGATCSKNRLLSLKGSGAITTAIEVGSGNTGNWFSGQIDGAATGIVDAGGTNFYRDLDVLNCTVAGIQQTSCSDNEFSRVKMSGNLIDWVTSGTINTTWLDEVESTMAGLTTVRTGARRAGIYGRTFYGAAVPLVLPYLRGDRVLNVSPTVGSPKAWTCSVGGTPGTWVSEGNL